MHDHSANHHPDAPAEVVRHDHGAWISGPSLSTEPVNAEGIEPGDVLILDDGIRARVTARLSGFYWLNGSHQAGIAVHWKEPDGTKQGILFRLATETLRRLVGEW
jgi:hypothetical protein